MSEVNVKLVTIFINNILFPRFLDKTHTHHTPFYFTYPFTKVIISSVVAVIYSSVEYSLLLPSHRWLQTVEWPWEMTVTLYTRFFQIKWVHNLITGFLKSLPAGIKVILTGGNTCSADCPVWILCGIFCGFVNGKHWGTGGGAFYHSLPP